jgi:hypothetical protein
MQPGHPSFAHRIFTTKLEKRIVEGYRRLFGVREIEEQPLLQIALGALLLSFFVAFSRWFYSHAITVTAYLENTHTCWPYFQDCGKWYFLYALPEGYSQSIVYMGLYALMVLVAYLMYRREWTLVHMLMAVLWIVKALILFVLTQQFAANYDYYDTLLLFVILFLPFKLFFARLTFVLLYFLASTIKIHEGWILGTYFTALSTGLPLFGNAVAPLVTNFVIFMQIVGTWFLMSRNMLLQRSVLVYMILFHLYSGILVGYRYPTVALVMLLVLFALNTKQTWTPVPLSRKAVASWLFIALLFVLQFIPIAIPGDQKLTLEGNFYGLFMFEANHQCVSNTSATFTSGTVRERTRQSGDSTWRCDPYEYWFNLKQACLRNENIERIAWTFDHSINGGPFYRIVDTQNVCELDYKPFQHNEWIRLPGSERVDIVGYPVKNVFQ